jgi:hypothetical protein
MISQIRGESVNQNALFLADKNNIKTAGKKEDDRLAGSAAVQAVQTYTHQYIRARDTRPPL